MTAPKPKDQHKPRGRPAHKPSKNTIDIVTDMARIGFRRHVIAERIGIDVDTLEKHYSEILASAKQDMLTSAGRKLFMGVLNGEDWAIKFALNMQGSDPKLFESPWSSQTQIVGAGGKDLFAGMDLTKLSDAELAKLKGLLAAAGVAIPDSA